MYRHNPFILQKLRTELRSSPYLAFYLSLEIEATIINVAELATILDKCKVREKVGLGVWLRVFLLGRNKKYI